MDPKLGLPPSLHSTEPLPPPTYDESQYNRTPNNTEDKTSRTQNTHQIYSTQIQQQLSNLGNSITSIQAQYSLLTTAQDEKILELLTSQIRLYLADFAASGLRKGQLILVPAIGLKDEKALPMNCSIDTPHEFNRFARIIDKENLKAIEEHKKARKSFGYGYGEGEASGDMWFWNDEQMAKRLAAYLRPQNPSMLEKPTPMDLPPRPIAKKVESGSKGFWGWKKKDEVGEETLETSKIRVPKREDDGVMMEVKAQQVFFEVENDCGILESKSGFGIVMRLRVVLGS